MVVANKKEAVIFDTPSDNPGAAELINWITKKRNCNIKAVIPTHFHEDCVGGLNEFEKNKIPSYANMKTIELAEARNFDIPKIGFEDSLVLTVGNKKVIALFLGEGHTTDNIIGYFPDGNILFGGCLIKEIKAGKGNLEDANVKAWAETVENVKHKFPDVKVVIPGHGACGDKTLLDYTIQLFQNP
jgi:metallo-beta-lactamase class B